MRRDYFTLDVTTTGDLPMVTVAFDGPADAVGDRFGGLDGADGDALDVAFRLRASEVAPETEGVFAIARRTTGEFVLECDTTAEPIDRLVAAARTTDGDDNYRLVVTANGEPVVETTLSNLLVYDMEGTLLAGNSLVPSGVEL